MISRGAEYEDKRALPPTPVMYLYVSVVFDGLCSGGCTPAGTYKGSPEQNVSVTWRIRNVGDGDWRTDSIDYGYVSGEKMSAGADRFDLQRTVSAGQEGDITVLFKLPDGVGAYSTISALYRGSTAFCEFSFSVVVE